MESDKSLPAHKEGEVCVRGPQVMKGYFKNEKATNETIIDNWIHTGEYSLLQTNIMNNWIHTSEYSFYKN